MKKEMEAYKQQLFETAAEYGRAGRAAYAELEQHIDEALEHDRTPKDILADLEKRGRIFPRSQSGSLTSNNRT